MNIELKKRLKSLLWRAGGMAFIASSAYILQVGDIFALDAKVLLNVAILAFMGLVVGEITKILNNQRL